MGIFAAIPGLVQAGMGIYGAIKNRNVGKQSDLAKEGMTNLSDYANQFQQYSGEIQPTAQGYLNQSQAAFDPTISFWSQLLKGGAGATSVLAPDIARTNAQYDQALQTQQQLNPRGGPGSAFLAQQPYAKAAQIGGLYSSLRPQAATSLAQIGGQTGALGINSLYAMLNALQGATGTTGTLLAGDVSNRYADMSRTGQQVGLGSMLGSSLFDLLKMIPGLGGTGGGSGNQSPQGVMGLPKG